MKKGSKQAPEFSVKSRATAIIKCRRQLNDYLTHYNNLTEQIAVDSLTPEDVSLDLVFKRAEIQRKFYVVYYRLARKYNVIFEQTIGRPLRPKFEKSASVSFDENEQLLLREVLEHYMDSPLFRSFRYEGHLGRTTEEKIARNNVQLAKSVIEWRQTEFDRAGHFAYQKPGTLHTLTASEVKFLYSRLGKALSLLQLNRAKNAYLPGEVAETDEHWRKAPRNRRHGGTKFLRYVLPDEGMESLYSDAISPVITSPRTIDRLIPIYHLQLRQDERDILVAFVQSLMSKIIDAADRPATVQI